MPLVGRVGVILGALALCACATAPPSPPSVESAVTPADWRYALVIDASSSASTVFVYQWKSRSNGRLPRIVAAPYPLAVAAEPWTLRVRPGLSTFAEKPGDGARSLEPLITYALERIPPTEHTRTTVHLWATAGLRLLAPEARDEILAAVAELFASTPFDPTPPRVLSGEEEGIYGWLTANYLLGHLEHGGPFPTVGALDLGGASTQITFVPLDLPRESGQVVRLGDNAYHLYTHSYLGLGQDRVRQALAEPACFPNGFPLAGGSPGTGDLAACRSAIRAHVGRSCAAPPCSAFGVYQPPVYGDFLAFSVYAYTADFFDLAGRLRPIEVERAATAFCAASWSERLRADPSAADNPFLPTYCFAAAYIVELLGGFGFAPDTEKIQAPLRVQGSDTGWTLGALLYEIAGEGD